MLVDAYLIFIKRNFLFKYEYCLTMMHTCLNVIVVFFYLDLHMWLCISCVGYILTL